MPIRLAIVDLILVTEGSHQSMWAYFLKGPKAFDRVSISAPRIEDLNDGEVIVNMEAGAICGSDLPYFRGTRPDESAGVQKVPGFPLHEIVGAIVASRSDLSVGQRVVGWATNHNALAEKVVSNANSLAPVNTNGDAVKQSIIQPLACVIYAVQRLGEVRDCDVAIVGQGPFGLLFSHVLSSYGARSVTGIDPVDRREFASAFGVSRTITASSDEWAAAVGETGRPEIVLEAVGRQASTLGHAIVASANNSRIYCFGAVHDSHYAINMSQVQRNNLTIMSGVTPFSERRHSLEKAQSYLKAYPALADHYISHVYSPDYFQTAFELADTPSTGQLKVALRWNTST